MKKLVLVLMAFAFVVTLAGCGGGGGGGGGSSYKLDYGENGSTLKKYDWGDLTGIKTGYNSIQESFDNNSSSDADGTIRSNVIYELLSIDYVGNKVEHENGAKPTDMTTREKVRARMKTLIGNNEFSGLKMIPFKLKDGASAEPGAIVTETTKFHVDKAKYGGETIKNYDFTFDLKWKNEGTKENPVWKIVSGFDDLGKNRSDL